MSDINQQELPHAINSSSMHSVSLVRRFRVLTWLPRISRFFLSLLFFFTAGAKLFIIKTFAQNVTQLLSASGFNYQRWSWPVTIAVIVVELITGSLLLWSHSVRLGAVLAGLLLISFASYALYYVYVLNGEPLECGCFGGIIASQLGVKTALRNLALLVPVFLVWFGYRRARQQQEIKTIA